MVNRIFLNVSFVDATVAAGIGTSCRVNGRNHAPLNNLNSNNYQTTGRAGGLTFNNSNNDFSG